MDSPEILEPAQERPRSTEELKLNNKIQSDLMARYCERNGLDQRTGAMQWFEKDAAAFRETARMRPDLLELYESDPDTALAELERIIG